MESKLKPYGDIVAVTGKYMKDGKERNRYHKVGILFATPHFSNMSIKLDSTPLTGDGWLKVFPRDDATQSAEEGQSDQVNEPIGPEDF